MRILILSKYDKKGPSSRYRSYNYTKYFKRNGIAYVFCPMMNTDYINQLYSKNALRIMYFKLQAVFYRMYFLLFKIKNYDLIIIEKELFPNLPYFIEAFLLKGKNYSLDFDDYVAASYKIGTVKKMILGSKIDRLARKARFNTVGNRWYFNEIKSDNLYYLPSVINIKKYPDYKKEVSVSGKKMIVWIGSPSTENYLKLLIPVFEKLSENYSFALKIIGSNLTIPNVEVINVAWESHTEVQELLSADVGIMPLEDTLWEKGKCGFKLIQYMACGLPVVASPAPANEEIVSHGQQGYIAKNQEEWYEYLALLLLDDKKRLEMGTAGRKRIEEHYTYQIWGDVYSGIINKSLN